MSQLTHVSPRDPTKKNSPVLNESKPLALPGPLVCLHNGREYQLGQGICDNHIPYYCGVDPTTGNAAWIKVLGQC